jgi:hypothetical protein
MDMEDKLMESSKVKALQKVMSSTSTWCNSVETRRRRRWAEALLLPRPAMMTQHQNFKATAFILKVGKVFYADTLKQRK